MILVQTFIAFLDRLKHSLKPIQDLGITHWEPVATTRSLRHAGLFNCDLDSFARLPVSVSDCFESLVTEVNMVVACPAEVTIATLSTILARVAWVVRRARIRDSHDDACAL